MSERSAKDPGGKLGPSDQLTVQYTELIHSARLVVTGAVDASSVGQFTAALDQAAARGRAFVVDVRELSSLAAVGVRALWRHQSEIAAILVTPASAVHQVLTISGLPGDIPVVARP